MDKGEEIILNSNIFNQIKELINEDKLFHSTMLINGDIDYLQNFARVLSKQIMCSQKNAQGVYCNTCHSCEKIEHGVHPDIMVYGVEKPLDAEGVTQLLDSVSVSPYEGDKKVYILSNVDGYSPVVLNKLLKTLEEPPKKSFFILLSKSEYRVLPTILSRCQKYYPSGYTVSDIAKILEGSVNADIIAVESLGQLSRAKKLVSEGGADGILPLMYDYLANLRTTKDLLEFEKKFDPYLGDIQTIVDLTTMIVGDGIKLKVGKNELITNKKGITQIKKATEEWPINGLVMILDACMVVAKMKDAGVTNQNIVDQFLLKILEVRRKCRK